MTYKRTRGEIVFDVFNNLFMLFIVVIMLFPFVNQFALSFSDNTAVLAGRVSLIPVNFTLEAYYHSFADPRFLLSLRNSVFVTVVSVLLSVSATAVFAYPLSMPQFKGRRIIMTILIFSMLFGTGGLIPEFLNMRRFGLIDTYWALWLPGMINIWNLIIMKSFLQRMPEGLIESAEIDGASHIRTFLQIVVPLAKAPLATISLFVAVGSWNSFFAPLVYINSSDRLLLAVYLREVVTGIAAPTGPAADRIFFAEPVSPFSIRAATLMASTIPIVMVYPFLQKYFVKGMLIGAIKG